MILPICPSITRDFSFCCVEVDGRRIIVSQAYGIGGKGINVALALGAMSDKTFNLSFLPREGRDEFVTFAALKKLETDFILTDGGLRTSYKFQVGDDHEEYFTPKIGVTERETEEFLDLFAEKARDCSMVVLSGSLPNGLKEDFFVKLCARAAGKQICIDSYAGLMMNTLSYEPLFVKMNRREAALTLGKEITEPEDAARLARSICERGASSAAVTLGPDGMVAYSFGKATQYFYNKQLEISNTTGAGDALMAAACSILRMGGSPHDAAVHGMAAAAKKIGQIGVTLEEDYKDMLPIVKWAAL